MSFNEVISSGFANYAVFRGRATRPEYWFWVLFLGIGMLVTQIIDTALFVKLSSSAPLPLHSPLNSTFILVLLLPSLALQVRRLHDIDGSGWWLLLVPTGIGILLLLSWSSQEGTPDDNRFGPGPLADKGLRPRSAH